MPLNRFKFSEYWPGPTDVDTKFLEAWRAGKPKLSVLHLDQQDYCEQIEALGVMNSLDVVLHTRSIT